MHIELEPIGVMRTSYRSKYDAPRQPGAFSTTREDSVSQPDSFASSLEASIVFQAHRNFEQALHDLQGFDRIWILSWFDRARGWKPKVLPPRSYGKRGVFATRSPHRPNPIGLSVARIVRIEKLTIVIAETDLLDGTPVLDIKPYLPYADAFPDSAIGWLASEARKTEWTVVYADSIGSTGAAGLVSGSGSVVDERLRLHIDRVLSLDPMPHPYRRTKHIVDNQYELAVRQMRVTYNVVDNVVTITRIAELPIKP